MDFEGRQSSRPTMMVLHNPELLEGILQYLNGYQTTLVSASLTAKAFSEPAFNVLWYEMDSLWPLFRILPTFKRGTDGKYAFTGAIRNEHLQRVLYYAKRIRFLDYKDYYNILYSIAPRDLVTPTIMRMDKLGAFIPLREIHLHDPLSHTMLLPLASPNLEKIDIRTYSRIETIEIGLASFLQSVASQCPLLRTLAIGGTLRDVILQVLPDFVNLHSLIIFLEDADIPPHFLKLFASSMPSLQDLDITILGHFPALPSDTPQKREQTVSIFHFPSLKNLVIFVAGDPIHPENLFSGLDAPRLKSGTLGLFQSNAVVSAHMYKFVERNWQLLKDKIHNLIIETADLPLSLIKSFENLKDLIVSPSHGAMSMSDIVHTFEHDGSWSRFLTALQLVQTDSLNGMSIAALHFIADACPNLQSLKISIHLPERPEKIVKKDGQESKPHGLEDLQFLNLPGVWDDTISLAIELVSLLEHLFPSMAVPQYAGGKTDKPGAVASREAWWKGVQDMWRMYHTIKYRKFEKQPLLV